MNNRNFPIQNLLIDLDGTLINTLPDRISAIQHMLTTLNLPPIKAENIQLYIGDGVYKLNQRVLAESLNDPNFCEETLIQKAIQLYESYYFDHICENSFLYPTALDTLVTLHDHGIQLALVSNKKTIHTQKIIQELNLSSLFSVILGGEDAAHKPKPDLLLLAMKHLKAIPQHTLMIGDSVDDITASKGAGINMIGVSYGYRPLNETLCPTLINSFSELIPILKEITYEKIIPVDVFGNR